LHPPGSAPRVNNNALPGTSADHTPSDGVNSLLTTLCGRRDLGELDNGAGAGFLGMTALKCKAEDGNKGEHQREFFRSNICRARRTSRKVLFNELVHARHGDADYAANQHREQTRPATR